MWTSSLRSMRFDRMPSNSPDGLRPSNSTRNASRLAGLTGWPFAPNTAYLMRCLSLQSPPGLAEPRFGLERQYACHSQTGHSSSAARIRGI